MVQRKQLSSVEQCRWHDKYTRAPRIVWWGLRGEAAMEMSSTKIRPICGLQLARQWQDWALVACIILPSSAFVSAGHFRFRIFSFFSPPFFAPYFLPALFHFRCRCIGYRFIMRRWGGYLFFAIQRRQHVDMMAFASMNVFMNRDIWVILSCWLTSVKHTHVWT